VSSQPHSGGAQQPQEAQQSRGSRIDRYIDRYAARAQGMVASEIRALFAVAERPEIVSLTGGMPFIAALPLDAVGERPASLSPTAGWWPLQYGSGQGDPGGFSYPRDLLCLAAARGS
jgi:2-aminoadipate transaminase